MAISLVKRQMAVKKRNTRFRRVASSSDRPAVVRRESRACTGTRHTAARVGQESPRSRCSERQRRARHCEELALKVAQLLEEACRVRDAPEPGVSGSV